MRALALVVALVAAAPAFADSSLDGSPSLSTREPGGLLDASPQRRNHMVSVYLGLPYWYSYYGFPFGLSARYTLPLVADGFVPNLNDSFSLEFGADVAFYGGPLPGGFLAIPIEAMWALHFFPRLMGYVKLGIALDFNFSQACWGNVCRGPWAVGPLFIGVLGGAFKITDLLVLRLELGYPWVKLGLGFAL